MTRFSPVSANTTQDSVQQNDHWGLIIIGGLFTLFGALLGWFLIKDYQERSDKLNSGIKTEATVIEVRYGNRSRRGGSYKKHPVLQFRDIRGNTQTIEKDDYDYDYLQKGDKVSIAYMADSPYIVEIVDAPIRTLTLVISSGAAIISILGIAAMSAGLRQLSKNNSQLEK